jgi:hypothetical protein
VYRKEEREEEENDEDDETSVTRILSPGAVETRVDEIVDEFANEADELKQKLLKVEEQKKKLEDKVRRLHFSAPLEENIRLVELYGYNLSSNPNTRAIQARIYFIWELLISFLIPSRHARDRDRSVTEFGRDIAVYFYIQKLTIYAFILITILGLAVLLPIHILGSVPPEFAKAAAVVDLSSSNATILNGTGIASSALAQVAIYQIHSVQEIEQTINVTAKDPIQVLNDLWKVRSAKVVVPSDQQLMLTSVNMVITSPAYTAAHISLAAVFMAIIAFGLIFCVWNSQLVNKFNYMAADQETTSDEPFFSSPYCVEIEGLPTHLVSHRQFMEIVRGVYARNPEVPNRTIPDDILKAEIVYDYSKKILLHKELEYAERRLDHFDFVVNARKYNAEQMLPGALRKGMMDIAKQDTSQFDIGKQFEKLEKMVKDPTKAISVEKASLTIHKIRDELSNTKVPQCCGCERFECCSAMYKRWMHRLNIFNVSLSVKTIAMDKKLSMNPDKALVYYKNLIEHKKYKIAAWNESFRTQAEDVNDIVSLQRMESQVMLRKVNKVKKYEIRGSGYGFIMFRSVEAVDDFMHNFRKYGLQVRTVQDYQNAVLKTGATVVNRSAEVLDKFMLKAEQVNYGSQDIAWDHLFILQRFGRLGPKVLRIITIFVITLLIVFFSTPLALTSTVQSLLELTNLFEASVDQMKKLLGPIGSLLFQYLPTLALLISSMTVPYAIILLSNAAQQKTHSNTRRLILKRTYTYLIISTLILPTMLLSSVDAAIQFFLSFNDPSQAFGKLFIPASGAFFINYILQRAILKNMIDFLKIGDVLKFFYSSKLSILFSSAGMISPQEKLQKTEVSALNIELEYAYHLSIMGIALCLSVFTPLILPAALLYFIGKHLADRYNVSYIYGQRQLVYGVGEQPLNGSTLSKNGENDFRSHYKTMQLITQLVLINLTIFTVYLSIFFGTKISNKMFIPHFSISLFLCACCVAGLIVLWFLKSFVINRAKLLAKQNPTLPTVPLVQDEYSPRAYIFQESKKAEQPLSAADFQTKMDHIIKEAKSYQ